MEHRTLIKCLKNELSMEEWRDTFKMYPIKTIIFKEEDELVVYATKVEDSQN